MRLEKADLRPERADFRLERADFRLERSDFRLERADFGPERGDKRTDGRTNELTNGRTKVPLCPKRKREQGKKVI